MLSVIFTCLWFDVTLQSDVGKVLVETAFQLVLLIWHLISWCYFGKDNRTRAATVAFRQPWVLQVTPLVHRCQYDLPLWYVSSTASRPDMFHIQPFGVKRIPKLYHHQLYTCVTVAIRSHGMLLWMIPKPKDKRMMSLLTSTVNPQNRVPTINPISITIHAILKLPIVTRKRIINENTRITISINHRGDW